MEVCVTACLQSNIDTILRVLDGDICTLRDRLRTENKFRIDTGTDMLADAKTLRSYLIGEGRVLHRDETHTTLDDIALAETQDIVDSLTETIRTSRMGDTITDAAVEEADRLIQILSS